MTGQGQNHTMHIFRASILIGLLYTIYFSFAENLPEMMTSLTYIKQSQII